MAATASATFCSGSRRASISAANSCSNPDAWAFSRRAIAVLFQIVFRAGDSGTWRTQIGETCVNAFNGEPDQTAAAQHEIDTAAARLLRGEIHGEQACH